MSTIQLTDRKLPLKVKLGFPIMNFGTNLQTLVQIFFLVYFYVNILGISGAAAGMIILIARCWDFINDPIMGMLLERTGPKKGGKSLFFIKRALVPTCIFFVLAYTTPNFSIGLKIFWAAATYIFLGMSQTVISISSASLRPKLTTDKVERQKLNVFESVFSAIVNIGVPAVTMPLFAYLQGFGVNTAFVKLAAIYAVVWLISGFLGLYLMKGQELDEEQVETIVKKKVKFSEMLKALATNQVAMLVLLSQVLYMFFSSLGGGALIYYCKYNLGNGSLMTVVSSLGLVGYLSILFLVPLYKKFGNAGIGFIGTVIVIASYLVRLLTHDATALIFIGFYALGLFGASMVSNVMTQNLMDSIDYGEWKTGKRNVSVLMAASGIGTKIGMAFGGTVTAFVIGMIGFDPAATVQPERVLNAFFILSVTAPLIMQCVKAAIFLYIRKIEKKLPQMREEIAARKATAAVNATKTAEGSLSV